MENRRKRWLLLLLGILILTGCGGEKENESKKKTTILVAAAASLRYSLEEELKPMFEAAHSDIEVMFTFDSSGKLQKQIEEGADVDVFLSAAEKQMNELVDVGLIKSSSIVKLLQNQIVLIVPTGAELSIESFADVLKAGTIAIGDPESVPVGQYTKELFEKMGIWDQVFYKSSLGTNVTEVLNWVSNASADAGVVYATDAATDDNVKVIETATQDQISPAIYPVGITSATEKEEAAGIFVDFLSSDAALKVFEEHGFIPVR